MESRLRRSAALEARERIRKVAELSQRMRNQHIEHNRLHSSALNITPLRKRPPRLNYDPDEAEELSRIEQEELQKYRDFVVEDSSDESSEESEEEESAESEDGEEAEEEEVDEELQRYFKESLEQEVKDKDEEVDLADYSVISNKPSEIIFRYNTPPSKTEMSNPVTQKIEPHLQSSTVSQQPTRTIEDSPTEESQLPPKATDLAAEIQQ